MKVLHIVGHSGSGKTTFITRLVPELRKLGGVATIKHLGHHTYDLPEGKDTTVFFESGVTISEGIDSDKSVILFRDPNLFHALDRLADLGIDFAIVEGFKSVEIPGIVIGNLPVSNALMADPTVEGVIRDIRIFPDIQTKNGQEMKIRDEWMKLISTVPDCAQCNAGIYSCRGNNLKTGRSEGSADMVRGNHGVIVSLTSGVSFPGSQRHGCYEKLVAIAGTLCGKRTIAGSPVLTAVAVRNRLGSPGPEEIYITAISASYRPGIVAVSQVSRELKEIVTPLGVVLHGIE